MNDMDKQSNNHADEELRRYLAGEHPLSARYHEANPDEPPPALDAAVHATAHAAATPRWRRWQRWQRPVAVAAVLVLCLGLLFQLQFRPQQQPEAQPQAMRHATPTARVETVPAPALQPEIPTAQQNYAPAARSKNTAKPARITPPAPQSPMAAGPTVDAQLTHIRQLLAAGQRQATVNALRKFISIHPDYKLPEALAKLAASVDLSPSQQ